MESRQAVLLAPERLTFIAATQTRSLPCWCTGKIAKSYEAQGGDYENQPGSKNKPKKGSPEHKDETGELSS